MAEYIEREFLLRNKFVDSFRSFFDCQNYESIIKQAPTADVVEVRHGEWLKTTVVTTYDGNRDEDIVYRCSLCGRQEPIQEPYCNCGAKMDGKKYEK